MGIENRYYLGYFLGIPEQHTNLKYISLTDRSRANRLSQDLRGVPFLEFTHSKETSIGLLKAAGFAHVQVFWLYPDHRFPSSIIPIDKTNILRFFIEMHLDIRGFSDPLLYNLYRYLDPEFIGEHVGHFGFLASSGR
jgi:hypothetical protein